MPKRPFKDDIAAGDKQEDPTDGVATLAKHIEIYAVNKQVPEDLSKHVSDTREAQEKWYTELLKAWRNLKATPTPEQATELVANTLKKIYHDCVDVADLEGFLYFYRLPHYASLPQPNSPSPVAEDMAPEFSWNQLDCWPTNIVYYTSPVFLLNTLPVTENDVKDGCHFTASVEVKYLQFLPSKTQFLISERRRALEMGDKLRADDLLKEIDTEDYQVKETSNGDVVTKRFQIRIRGFGKSGRRKGAEGRDKLVKVIKNKCLMITVYGLDKDMHCVGDIYFDDNTILHERLLE